MKTGISGLDDVLRGGFPLRRLYLVQGAPGSGKTTLALQFLLEGARNGETVLYISLSETREEIEEVADLARLVARRIGNRGALRDRRPIERRVAEHAFSYGGGRADRNHEAAARRSGPGEPDAAGLRFALGAAPAFAIALRYRRQILAFKQFFAGRNCTTLLLDDTSTPRATRTSRAWPTASFRWTKSRPITARNGAGSW